MLRGSINHEICYRKLDGKRQFYASGGKPLYPVSLNKALYRMVNKYNETHPERKIILQKMRKTLDLWALLVYTNLVIK